MAAAHCATAAATISFVFPPARKRSVIVSAIPIRFPSKPVKRKNYLRPKILKTLTKPYPIPHELTPANPFIPIESPLEQQKQQQLDFPSDQFVIQEVKESDGIEEQKPPKLCSDQIVSHYVEVSESIEGKPGVLSDQFSGEGMKAYHSDIPFDQFVSEEYGESDRLEQLPELDADRFAGENIGVSEVRELREFSQSEETRSSSEHVKPIAGNPFSSFSMIQIGVCFIGACVIDSIWSIWLAKKINSFKKDQNLGIDDNKKPKSELLLKENNDGNNKEKLELLLKESNDGKSKPNPEHLLKEKNDGNNKPKPEVLLKENNDGGNKPKSEQLKENGNLVRNMNEGAVVYESEMDKKISEIRALAREARKREKLQSEENSVVEDEEEYEDDDDDLVLRNSEKSTKEHPWSPKGLGTEKVSKTLMFKKKLRLTSLGIDAEDTKPKDILGRQDHMTVVKANEKLQNGHGDNYDFDVLARDEKLDVPVGELLNNVSTTSLEENKGGKVPAKETARKRSSSRKKIVKEKAQTKPRVTKSEQLNQSRSDVLGSSSMPMEEEDKGVKLPVEESIQIQGSRKKYVKEKRRTKPSPVQEKVKPVSLEAQFFGDLVPSKYHDMLDSVPKKHDDLNGNGGLKIKEVATGKANNGFSGQQSYGDTDDFWWLSLRYVFAMVLRSDGGGSQGLYTLRSASQGRGDTIYRVAFEDHIDATNFCHILESYFEELTGFSAAITSIPTKELEEALKAKTMKVLVVKKGQLELYAGQPLPEVEKALKSLVGQS